MAVNKVEINGEVKLDLTGDTVTPETLLKDATAHNAAGEQIVGTMEIDDNAAGVIDKSVTSITSNAAEVGQYAFCGCEQLETVSFPRAAKIQGGAFIGCKALVSVSAPNATEIRSDVVNYTFTDMDGGYMKDILGAFLDCIALATVDFPAAVTIGDRVFSGCKNLTTVNFPMAETIYCRAFSNCEGLTNLKFPRVKTIGVSDNAGGGGIM